MNEIGPFQNSEKFGQPFNFSLKFLQNLRPGVLVLLRDSSW